MTLEELRQRFHVRVLLDWSQLGHARILRVEADEKTNYEDWYFPWYREGDAYEPGATPISVAEASNLPGSLAAKADERARSLADNRSRVTLDVLTWEIGDGRRLVLDGNHRLAGLLRRGTPFTVLAHSLDLPGRRTDPSVLPDLRHFRGGGSGRRSTGPAP